jgi:hypothetical protein
MIETILALAGTVREIAELLHDRPLRSLRIERVPVKQ